MPGINIEKRMRITDKLARDLRKLACRHNCAILTINQLTSKINLHSESTKESAKFLVPNLGHSWANHLDWKILFSGDDEKGRYAELLKCKFGFDPLISVDEISKSKERIEFILNVKKIKIKCIKFIFFIFNRKTVLWNYKIISKFLM